jgi:UDP-3-O-[3-hydroxymyristoyl] glucosamine N-acyltransferase
MEFTAKQIAGYVDGTLVGNADAHVSTFAKIEEAGKGALTFMANPAYEHYLYQTEASVVLVNKDFEPAQPVSATLIKVTDAREALGLLLQLYEKSQPRHEGQSSLAYVAPTAKIGKNVFLAPFSAVGDGAEIGDGAQLHPHATVGARAKVGKDTIMYPNSVVYHDCVVGSGCILHAGCVIGADGFGFAPTGEGGWDKIDQIGNVILEDNVEVGANTCVDRATMGSTILHQGVKVDNLCQVAHNVVIGQNTAMASQVGIAGSCKVGSDCIIAGQAGLVGHITVGDHVTIGAQSGVTNSVASNQTIFGSPAMEASKRRKVEVLVRNIEKLANRISALEKK